jgi:hypothetical protein
LDRDFSKKFIQNINHPAQTFGNLSFTENFSKKKLPHALNLDSLSLFIQNLQSSLDYFQTIYSKPSNINKLKIFQRKKSQIQKSLD